MKTLSGYVIEEPQMKGPLYTGTPNPLGFKGSAVWIHRVSTLVAGVWHFIMTMKNILDHVMENKNFCKNLPKNDY
jgi:hypothetical protein